MPLQIHIKNDGEWDEINEVFLDPIDTTIVLEHSLVSLQKWEAKIKKPFLSTTDKTVDEVMYYLKCMTISQNVKDNVYNYITAEQMKVINDYINDPMTATQVKESKNAKKNRDVQTAETLYSTMIDCEIPFECRKWHLNQLLKLIEVRAIKSQGAQKMSKKDQMAQQRALNSARHAKHKH